MSAPQDSTGKAEPLSNNKKVTPRALVRKQVENEDFHASEEDIANLDTSVESVEIEIKEFSEQLEDDDGKDKTKISNNKSRE